MNNLTAHAGAIMTTEEHVYEFPAPERTESYSPVAHGVFIDLLAEAVDGAGLRIEDKRYALSVRRPRTAPEEYRAPVEGERMFGLWELNRMDNGHRWAIGFRNSYDRSMSIGIAAGTRVFICDNLALSGEYISMRKHTSGLDYPELVQLTRGAVVKVVKKLDGFSKWIRALGAVPVSTEEAMLLFVDGLEKNVFPPSKFKKLLNCWHEERKIQENQPTLGNVYNSFTRLVREDNLFKIADSTAKLEGLIDEHIIMQNRVQA